MNKKTNHILTIGHEGQDYFLVSIETVVKKGLFQFDIIGLANKTISESKQRILSALDHTLLLEKKYVHRKITTLLSPAGIKKEGSHFDLPIAISYCISNLVKNPKIHIKTKDFLESIFSDVIILGELTLTGSILSIPNIARLMKESIQKGIIHFIVPKGDSLYSVKNTYHAYAVDKCIYIWEIENISEIIQLIQNIVSNTKTIQDSKYKENLFQSVFKKYTETNRHNNAQTENQDVSYIYNTPSTHTFLIDSIEGNWNLKKAILIALAGKHHIMIAGEPGCGKSIIAKSTKELIPPITLIDMNQDQIDCIDLFTDSKMSFSETETNENTDTRQFIQAPFREPHHTSTYTEIIGNKNITGEISLAHKGILFMDEFSEINKRVIEGLRQPLEYRYIQKNQRNLIETDFILIGCMNLCDCGFYKSETKHCICSRGQIDKFIRKINSPLMQRFDLYIHLENQKTLNSNPTDKLSGQYMREKILRVRKIQENRILDFYSKLNKTKTESKTVHKQEQRFVYLKHIHIEIDKHHESELNKESLRLLQEITNRFYYSKREIYSLIRIARTIADLDENDSIQEQHILEALSFKRKS